jgi:predicted esterase
MGGMTSYYLTLNTPNLFDGAILMAPAIKNSLGKKVVKLTKIL